MSGVILETVNYFRGTLAEVGPAIRFVCKAMLVCSLGTPDYAGARPAWVKASMGAMTFMSVTKLAMYLRILFTTKRSMRPDLR